MKVLQICPRVPFPVKDGGAAAMYNIHNGLIDAGIDAQIFAINTLKHFVDEKLIFEQKKLNAITINTEVTFFKAFLNLFSRTSYNVNRFYSEEAEKELTKVLSENEFDIIQLESIYVSSYIDAIKKNSKAKIILRSHNIEHELLLQQSTKQNNIFKKLYLKYLSKKLQHLETKLAPIYDGIAVISKPELNFYASLTSPKKIVHIPFGIDLPTKPEYKIEAVIKFYFVGALDWQPNIEAALWLIEKIWQPYFSKNNKIELHIAGKNSPDLLKTHHKANVFIHGEVENISEFISTKHIMLCPLFAGSGMRIKIVEALVNAKPIIATALAAEGIELEKNNCGFLAENVDDYKNKIEFCITNFQTVETLSSNAYSYAKANFSNQNLTTKLIEFYKTILQ